MSSQPATISEPHDRCFRCGKPTPLGVPLCADDNPGQIKGPSTTQVHGTIVIGIIIGFIVVAALGRLVTSGGPFAAGVIAQTTGDDGRTQVVISVTNNGATAAPASCRISQGGLVGSGDDVFFSDRIPAGATYHYTRFLPASGDGRPTGRIAQVAVICN